MAPITVPYKVNLSLPVNSSVKIQGKNAMPFNMSPEMQVDFHTKTEVDSDIAFSFRVYFGKCVLVNSRKNWTWGQEVQYTDMPFEDGQPFDLDILVLSDQYRVIVNGVQCYTFPHRIDAGSVKMMQVWRDVSLTSVMIPSKGCDQTPRCQGDPST